MAEDAETLLHSNKGINKLLKNLVRMLLVSIISWLEYGLVNVESNIGWPCSLIPQARLPFLCFVFRSKQAGGILSSRQFLFMIFFSTLGNIQSQCWNTSCEGTPPSIFPFLFSVHGCRGGRANGGMSCGKGIECPVDFFSWNYWCFFVHCHHGRSVFCRINE
jgi:hypothetical protein